MSLDKEIARLSKAVREELQEIIAQYVETDGKGLCVTNESAKHLAHIIRNKHWVKEGL